MNLFHRVCIRLLAPALLAGCSAPLQMTDRPAAVLPPSVPLPAPVKPDLTAEEAVSVAAERPISGTFAFEVRGAGRRDERLYLNSEVDYRDWKCLTISVPDRIAEQLATKLGGDPAVVLRGKRIRVTGTAARVKIIFVGNEGNPTGAFYYQTHVRVVNLAQIEVPEVP